MLKGTKKPWTKVGKLEARIKSLEKDVEWLKTEQLPMVKLQNDKLAVAIDKYTSMQKIDFEELAARNETNKSAINIIHKSLLTRMDNIDNLITKLQIVFREW